MIDLSSSKMWPKSYSGKFLLPLLSIRDFASQDLRGGEMNETGQSSNKGIIVGRDNRFIYRISTILLINLEFLAYII